MSGLATLLKQVPYFGSLGNDELEALARAAHRREHGKAAVVLAEGAPCPSLFVVIRGRVKLSRMGDGGREQVLRIIGPGRTFGDEPVFDGGEAPTSAVALEPTAVAAVPKARVLGLVERHPQVALAVARGLASRLRDMTDVVEDLALHGVAERIARLLLACHCGRPLLAEGAGDACERLTQQRLAAMTGSVREVVQRALKALEAAGAVELSRGHVRVRDAAALEGWAGGGRGRRQPPPRCACPDHGERRPPRAARRR